MNWREIMGVFKRILTDELDLEPISTNLLHSADAQGIWDYLQERNEAKRQQAIHQLGDKWLMHPNNRIHKENRA